MIEAITLSHYLSVTVQGFECPYSTYSFRGILQQPLHNSDLSLCQNSIVTDELEKPKIFIASCWTTVYYSFALVLRQRSI